ncbi:DUF993 family protein, partial [Azospirillum brasilense]|nr:DUF993 family protein [Azospirillum brasilense]
MWARIAPGAAGARPGLGAAGGGRYHEIREPPPPVTRHIFKAPTRFYKT